MFLWRNCHQINVTGPYLWYWCCRATIHYLNQRWQVLWRHTMSLGHNDRIIIDHANQAHRHEVSFIHAYTGNGSNLVSCVYEQMQSALIWWSGCKYVALKLWMCFRERKWSRIIWTFVTRDPFRLHELILSPVWIVTSIINEIIYPFPNFKGGTVEVWESVSNFTPHFTDMGLFSMLWLKLFHVSKRVPGPV